MQSAQSQQLILQSSLAESQLRLEEMKTLADNSDAALSLARQEAAALKQELTDALARAHLSEAHAAQMQHIADHLQSSISQQVPRSIHAHPGVHLMLLVQERADVERRVEELRAVCAAKVRSAEAKWEDAVAALERATEHKLNAASVSAACQTDDVGPRHLHSSSCQTSSESAKPTRDDSMLSGISAIEADYAKKVTG
jgi:hypothetical protein